MKIQFLESFDSIISDVGAKVAPWLAPLPTAFLIGRSTYNHLHWPGWVAVVAAITVEALGLATTATAMELREWNAHKRKTDPQAPAKLALGLVGLYFVTAIGLTVALDIFPELSTYAPAIFPLLSLAGVTILALRNDHRRRVERIEKEKADRKAERHAARQTRDDREPESKRVKVDTLDKRQALITARKQRQLDTLIALYVDNPLLSVSDAAKQTGVSRQTIYNHLNDLEEAGRIHRNGQGVEVL